MLAVGCHPVIRVGQDRVDTGPAEDVVRIAVVHYEDVIAVAAARPLVRVAFKVEAVVAAVAGEVVPTASTVQKIVFSAAVEIVVAIGLGPREPIIAALQLLSSLSMVGDSFFITYGAAEVDSGAGRTRSTVDVVGAPAAQQGISAGSARDVVPVPAAVDKIVPRAGGDHVAAGQGLDFVVELGAGDPVVLFGARAQAACARDVGRPSHPARGAKKAA